MGSGRERLMRAAASLLAEHPEREPSTRELYEAAGVTPPTLYHHFGTKDGLLGAVVDEAFAAYLERKRGVPHTGDLLSDFAAGWDMHVEFGVRNPILYSLMYRQSVREQPAAAATADRELRLVLQELADAGLLRVDVDQAAVVTTAMAIGCVTQCQRLGLSPVGALARSMRAALIAELTGQPPDGVDTDRAARALLARLGSSRDLFTTAETALLRQWLLTLADQPALPATTAAHDEPSPNESEM